MLDDPKVIEKKIKSAVTDTGREIVSDPAGQAGRQQPARPSCRALSGEPRRRLEAAVRRAGYGDLKKDVAEAVLDVTSRSASGSAATSTTRPSSTRCWRAGAEQAREVAAATLADGLRRSRLPARAPA